ncbi:hypothetical protein L1987_17826 [Smallanthus sonchifolius]|uniref:Uncharacterized protein n=1 Tax=Smallanthus sonchifolius TaxID=185202 RepID=A0ACB9J0J4_9ASTR|nr:hypothetical protein L1987_17826 [Smallanthus sonchifolius]
MQAVLNPCSDSPIATRRCTHPAPTTSHRILSAMNGAGGPDGTPLKLEVCAQISSDFYHLNTLWSQNLPNNSSLC